MTLALRIIASLRGKAQEIDQEAQGGANLINAIIEDTSTASDNARLGRIDDRIEHVNGDLRRYLERRVPAPAVAARRRQIWEAGPASLAPTRCATNSTRRSNRSAWRCWIRFAADAVVTMRDQQAAIVISPVLTLLAAVLRLLI